MNVNIEELITLNYELEGLLHLALHRGDNTPRRVWNLIAAKIEALKEGLPVQELADESIPEKIEEEKNEEKVDVEAPAASAEEAPLVNEETALPDDEDYSDLQPLPVPQEEEKPALTEDEIKTIIKEEELEAAEADPMDEPSFSVPQSGFVPYTEPAAPEKPLVSSEPIRLDEKLARENSRDLRKAFSLNDKFRFRRELFSNSEILMNETLDAIEAMSSIDEAADYFYTDLKWDKSNQDVADFVEIITHHFSSK